LCTCSACRRKDKNGKGQYLSKRTARDHRQKDKALQEQMAAALPGVADVGLLHLMEEDFAGGGDAYVEEEEEDNYSPLPHFAPDLDMFVPLAAAAAAAAVAPPAAAASPPAAAAAPVLPPPPPYGKLLHCCC
jgi:hypothetical protein